LARELYSVLWVFVKPENDLNLLAALFPLGVACSEQFFCDKNQFRCAQFFLNSLTHQFLSIRCSVNVSVPQYICVRTCTGMR
jgi:hypothetical protein